METEKIINHLLTHGNVDFSGYNQSMVAQQIEHRLNKTGIETVPEYCEYLQSHPEETDHLIDALIINVSGFFRDPIVFNYLFTKILPVLISEKSATADPQLRIWSAGCAAGEEPYSIAMDIMEILNNVNTTLTVNIFATDLDKTAIDKARIAVYPSESLNNMRLEYTKHFTQTGNTYALDNTIKQLVSFSKFDLMDPKIYCPSESVYGGFDVVLCRNVLIYYDVRCQNRILTKLYRSLNHNGYLVLGETETPTKRFQQSFTRITDCCRIFRKI